MNKFLMGIMSVLMLFSRANAMNVDAFMDKHIAPVSDKIAELIFFQINFFGSKVPLIILWILAAGIFFTIYFRGIAIWGLKEAIRIVTKPTDKSHGDCGEVSSFF